ncbi:hypothetical protein V5799_008835 [Amblyomma americanum]|uniref:Uncharacterized protein n=1 Tax=Amblyomma americanum TaxID=6943 RepID=A0AAQ4FDI6_AMBAM
MGFKMSEYVGVLDFLEVLVFIADVGEEEMNSTIFKEGSCQDNRNVSFQKQNMLALDDMFSYSDGGCTSPYDNRIRRRVRVLIKNVE